MDFVQRERQKELKFLGLVELVVSDIRLNDHVRGVDKEHHVEVPLALHLASGTAVVTLGAGPDGIDALCVVSLTDHGGYIQ